MRSASSRRVDVDGPLAAVGLRGHVGDLVAAHRSRLPQDRADGGTRSYGRTRRRAYVVHRGDDPVHEPVAERLLGTEPPVAPRVALDGLEVLPGVVADQPQHGVARVPQVVGLDRDVHRGAADAGRALVEQDSRMREREPLALRAGAEQELPRTARDPHRQRADVVGDQGHHVADRQHRRHRSTRRVDPQADVGVRVASRQHQQSVAEAVAQGLVQDATHHQGALVEQAAGQLVVDAAPGRVFVAHDVTVTVGVRRPKGLLP